MSMTPTPTGTIRLGDPSLSPALPPPAPGISDQDYAPIQSDGSGYVLSKDVEEGVVKAADELIDLYFNQLTPIWEEGVRNHNLYFAETEDPRSDEEKQWRAHIFPPRPQIITESKTAVLYDIITSTDPLIQAEGVEETDDGGLYGEKMLSYFMRGMGFEKSLPPFLRNISIQGTEFNKLYYGKRSHVFDITTSPQDLDRFTKAVMDAKVAHPDVIPPDPMGDPAGFKVWSTIVNNAGKVKVPTPPISGKREIKIYAGPMMDRVSFFDIWLDPMEDDLKKQPAVIHRIVKHERWWKSLAGDDPCLPFDAAAVERALSENHNGNWGKYGERFTTHKRAFYDILNVSPTSTADPIFDKSHEGFECYFGTDGVPGEYPYVVILNGVVVNKKPDQMPYMHGQIPIFAGRNLLIGGLFHGISDYRPLDSIFMENAALRNLRLDGAKLSMLPILAKLASIGAPALLKQLRPGMMVNVPRMDAFGQLFKMTMPDGAWREPADLQSDMDESSAAYGQVRGAPATVGRVSATENSGRFNQAISRLKLCVSQVENDHEDFPFQCLGIAYQYLDEEARLRIGGPGDPYMSVDKSQILESMEQDYRFLGATKAINRELIAQKLNDFGKTYAMNLTPPEMRVLMEDVIAAIGVRNAKRIVSSAGSKDAQDAYDIKVKMAKMQAAAAEKQMMMQQVAPTVPGVIAGSTAQAVSDSAGAPTVGAGSGGGAPPSPPPTTPPGDAGAPPAQ